MEIGFGAL
uniref:Uncharacterized protein n=1 Tax=Rhizophora mucronata TaxID=61149 RepID=A0A2P2R0D7_RHIMU